MRSFVVFVLLFSFAFGMSQEYEKLLKTIKSPLYEKSLYDIVTTRASLIEKLHQKYPEYSMQEIKFAVLHQPFEYRFWNALAISGKSLFWDLYVEQGKNALDIAKVTLLSSEKIALDVMKSARRANFFSVQEFFNLKKRAQDFMAMIDLLINIPQIWRDIDMTPQDIKKLVNKMVTKPQEMSIQDFDSCFKFINNLVKALQIVHQNGKLKGAGTITALINDFNKVEQEWSDFDRFQRLKNSLLKNEGFESESAFVSAHEAYYISFYYEYILQLQLIVDSVNVLASASALVNDTVADYVKAGVVLLKFYTGLAGMIPTYNQNVANYLQNAYQLYTQGRDFLNEDMAKLLAQKEDRLHTLIQKYSIGEELTRSELEDLVTLWKELGGGGNEFVTYILHRQDTLHKAWFANPIVPVITADGTAIELPYLGDVHNVTSLQGYYLEIWGKNGTIVKIPIQESMQHKFFVGTKPIISLRGGVSLPIKKEDAFFDAEDNIYYYKFGIFNAATDSMIYSFIPQKDGGYAPGWDYTKENTILLTPDNEIAINDNFGVLAFTIEPSAYKIHKRIVALADFFDVKNRSYSLLMPLNSSDAYALQKYFLAKFSIPISYTEANLLHSHYRYQDIFAMIWSIIAYTKQSLEQKELSSKEEQLFQKLKAMLSLRDRILRSSLIQKYSQAQLDMKLLQRYGVIAKHPYKLDAAITKVAFFRMMNRLKNFFAKVEE